MSVGAFELLEETGVWGRFEAVGLLRSRFPVSFLGEELACSRR
jgi:hypothetical protein